MKKSLIIILLAVFSMAAFAEPDSKFDPRQYKSELRTYIVARAGLTPQEASKFFKLFDEMKEKQRGYYRKIGQYMNARPMSEKDCLRAIKERDRLDIEIKHLQQTYDAKFLKVVPATKLLEIFKAEEEFNRTAFKKMSRNR